MFGRRRNKKRTGRSGCPQKECICPGCGNKVPHTRGMPCFQQKCPKCGIPMMGRFTTGQDKQ